MIKDIYFTPQQYTNSIDIHIGEETCQIEGLEPLVDENCNFTGIIGIYFKGGGITPEVASFVKKYRKRFIFVVLASYGPSFEKHYRHLYRTYSAVTALECSSIDLSRYDNNLNLNYPMFTRCGPLIDGFFWEPNKEIEKDLDFSFLTWYGNNRSKSWSDCKRVTIELCERGYKGVVVTQRKRKEDMLADGFERYVSNGLLEVYDNKFDEKQFHNVMLRAYVGIFPNKSDALPKHAIETLLADKGIVVSPELLFGSQTLGCLGKNVSLLQDFAKDDAIDNIARFIDEFKESEVSPRDEWLRKYDFGHLSRIWADEINRYYGTNYKQVFCMRHICRYVPDYFKRDKDIVSDVN